MGVAPLRLVILVAICSTCTFARGANEPRKDAGDDSATASLKHPLHDAAFDHVEFKDVIEFIADVGAVNLYVDRPALESAGIDPAHTLITMRALANGTVETALKGALANVGTKDVPVTFATCGSVVVISTKEGVKDFTERHRKALARARVAGADVLNTALPDLPMQDIPVSDVIDFLRDVTGANISVDWQKLEAVGVTRQTPITLAAKDIKLAQVLQLVLDQSWPTKAIGFEMKEGTITISTAPGAKDPPPHPKDKPGVGKQGL